VLGGFGDQDLAACGMGRDSRGEVDRRAEPVAVACGSGSRVQPDANRGTVSNTGHPVHDPERQLHGRGRLGTAKHGCVADQLQVSAADGIEELSDPGRELQGQVSSDMVAVDLGSTR